MPLETPPPQTPTPQAPPNPLILLATVNARYAHTAFALRYLRANLGALRPQSRILEFTHETSAVDIAEELLALDPAVVALSVYIWNVERLNAVVGVLKAVRPDLPVVIGGPEVSHELSGQAIVALADVVVTGEGEAVFAEICRALLAGEAVPAVVAGGLPELSALVLPYAEYTDEDLARRTVYVEASRGCPFRCAFCLSALDTGVRAFPLAPLLEAYDTLIGRGARRFKFIDRTFNLKISQTKAILSFFLARLRPGLYLDLELIPDRLPEDLRALIQQFPPGSLQFEVGVQSLDPAVTERIGRHQDPARLEDNLRFLAEHTDVHVHADLIVGLPGEDLQAFGRGLDHLHALGVEEIQVGILKRLKGTPIAAQAALHGLVFSDSPPYEVLRTPSVDFATMQRLKRLARVWDRTVNRGNFMESAPLVWGSGSVFQGMLRWSDWLFGEWGQVHAIALPRLESLLARFLMEERQVAPEVVAEALAADARARTVKRGGLERQLRRQRAREGSADR